MIKLVAGHDLEGNKIEPRGVAYFVRWGSGADTEQRELNDPDSVGALVTALMREGVEKVESTCVPRY